MIINPAGTLPPELFAEQQQLNRQQQLATMLMQQGQQQPQGQMVSGRFVPTSFFQNIAPVFAGYMGNRLAEQGDKRALDLATKLRERQSADLATYQNLMNPAPTLAPEQAGPTQTGQAIPREMVQNLPDRQAANLFAASSYNPALQAVGMKNLTQGPKFEKASFTDEKTGKVREGVMDMNAPNPITTFQVGGVKPEMTPYEIASLKLKAGDQAISSANLMFNTGMTAGGVPTNAPMGNAPVAGGMPMVAPSKDKFAPAVQPQYQYNPTLSPKNNQEAAAKFSDELIKNQKNAKDSFDLMKSASTLLSSEAPSSGRLSNIATGVGEFFGGGGESSKADARLNLLSGALTMKQPRFEGPQGVLDVILYQKLAGDLGNPNIPIASRLGTIEEMIDLQKKYYPEGNWDSISTKTKSEAKNDAVRSAGKVSLKAPQYATNPQTGQRIVSTDDGINWKPAEKK